MIAWAPSPGTRALAGSAVHVWRLAFDGLRPHASELERRLLAPDERARASRLRADQHRQAFVVARAVLRMLLGGYTGVAARDLRFAYGPWGKPALAGAPAIKFNVAHSEAFALYAIARDREVGVDLERIDTGFPRGEVAAHTFSPGDVATLSQVVDGEQARAFFVCWTAKEALMKARGDGLAGPLDGADVHGLTAVVDLVIEDERERGWTLHRLDPGNGHAAALAVEGVGAGLLQLELTPAGALALARNGP